MLFNIHIILLCWMCIVLLSIGYLSDIMRYYHIIDTNIQLYIDTSHCYINSKIYIIIGMKIKPI